MRLKRLKMTAAVMVLFAAYGVGAQQEAGVRQPIQEVFQTELVYPQEKGEMQVTWSPGFAKSVRSRLFQSPLAIEYGLTDNWQIEIDWSGRVFRREVGDEKFTRGSGDLRFGTKYSFMNMRGSNFHSAFGLEIGLPTGDMEKELSEGLIEYEPYFILAKDFPKLNGAQVFTQIGFGFVHRVKGDEDEPAAHEFFWNTGIFVPVKQVVLTSELNWQTNRWNRAGKDNELYFTPGVVWHPSRTWEIGLGLGVGLTRDADKLRGIVKLTYEF